MNRLLAAIALHMIAPVVLAGGKITVSDAWIREAPPVTNVQAGYFTVCNEGDAAVTLERFESEAFGRIEMHETIESDGTSRMERLQSLRIETGDCVAFERGGKHLMLFDATKRLVEGDTVTLRLVFDRVSVESEFPVRRGNDGSTNNHDHHEH